MYPYFNFGGKQIPTYGIFMAVGFIIALLIARYRAKKSAKSTDHLLIIVSVAMGCGLLAAKGLFLLVSVPFHVLVHALQERNFSLFSGGGLVFYGGLLGGQLGACLGAKIATARLRDFEGELVPCIPIGHAFGRLGCTAAGCCYGIPYSGIFCIRYPAASIIAPAGVPLFPVQLLEAFLDIFLGVGLVLFSQKPRRVYSILLMYCTLYSVERFFLEFLRGDRERGIYAGLSTSQWISITILAASLLYVCSVWLGKKQNPYAGR